MQLFQTLASADRELLLLLQQSESWFARHSRGISRSADGPLYVLLAATLAMVLPQGAVFAQHAAVAFAVERGLYWVTKNTLRRRRPANALPGFRSQIIASDEFSFPSGHTSAAFLFTTLLMIHLGPLALMLYPWAVAVAMARIFLGVHFPFDTLVGALLGATIATGTGAWLY
jgi:undecaprenyl-diphosphatase